MDRSAAVYYDTAHKCHYRRINLFTAATYKPHSIKLNEGRLIL